MEPKKWTDEEKDFVKQNYGKISTEEIAEKLGRTTGSIYSIMRKGKDKSKVKKAAQRKKEPTIEEVHATLINMVEKEKEELQARLNDLEKYERIKI